MVGTAGVRGMVAEDGRGQDCDGHHEMSDFGADGEPVHSGGESVAPVCPQPIRSLAKWSEVIMTNELRELRDDELDGVSGGLVMIAILAILIGPLIPDGVGLPAQRPPSGA